MEQPEPKVRLLSEVSPELVREATDQFASLVRERLPRSFQPPEPSWPLIAAAFLGRISGILESVTTLVERGQRADSMVMVRVLYDYASTFCWLGIDPEAHVSQWRRWDDWRLKALHNDAVRFGVEVLTPAELAALGDPPRPRGLAELADAIDKYWPEHSDAFRAHPGTGAKHILTFRGFYAAIFRKASGLVHATDNGVSRHLRLTYSEIIATADEQLPTKAPDVPAFAVPLTAFALFVHAHHFGWPDPARVREVTNALIMLVNLQRQPPQVSRTGSDWAPTGTNGR